MAKYSEPVISRETRLLLITVVASVLALWLLARIRFQEQAVTADPVPPVLAQLRPQSSFDDLARTMADMRQGIAASVFALDDGRPALRIREDAAITLATGATDTELAVDRPTRLAIVRSPLADLPGLMPWVPRVLDYPRYLIAAEFTQRNLALRPMFVGALFVKPSPLWLGEIWLLPPSVEVRPGAFVFTTDGALAGLAIDEDGQAAIVPATHLLRTAERLLRDGNHETAETGVSVQSLTPPVARATGAAAGVVVTAVDIDGPAAGALAATDVIEAVDGQDVVTLAHWRARVERLRPGETLTLRVRRLGTVSDVRLTAAAARPPAPIQTGSGPTPPSPQEDASLGLRMRNVAKVGAEVLSVEPLSRATRASIQPGDVITVAGQHTNPTAAQVTGAFNALPEGGSLLVALTRDSEHHVTVLEK
jgi:hypothetical protein